MTALICILAFVFIIGLCIGSFLNVVILRALSDESIVFPASKCPKCQTPLKWWHNIPVISYIFLGGKCAFCKEKISIQYPIIELLTGIIFVLLFLKFGVSFYTLFFWIISSLFVVIAGTDIKEKVVFDVHNYILIALGLLHAIVMTVFFAKEIVNLSIINNPLTSSVLGIIAGLLIMELLARSGYIFAGTRAFGEGDTFIAMGLGAVFGWRTLIVLLILSVIIQVILFLPVFVRGLVCNKDWKTLILFSIFVIFATGFFIIKPTGAAYTISAILLALIGIASCVFILKGLRENPSQRTYLPFGPAMVAAGLIGLLLL